jgi:hypothetical protein
MITTHTDITIRQLGSDDEAALAALAERDSAAAPTGGVLGAFTPTGALVAAVSLDTGQLVADPFAHTAHAAALLRVRAEQLTGNARHARGVRSRLRLRTAAV